MTPSSDNCANHSGSRCHYKSEDKPEQLHKEPESASPSRDWNGASTVPATSIVATDSKITTTTSTHPGDLATYDDNNKRNMKLRLSSRVAELPIQAAAAAEEEDNNSLELTSLFTHLDEVKRDLELLLVNCTTQPSTRAPKTTTTTIASSAVAADETIHFEKNHRQEVERKSEEMRDHSSLLSKSPVGRGGCGSSSASSLQGTSLLGENLNDLTKSSLLDQTGAKSAENFERKQATTTNNIILIVQHLIQKRKELRCIDRKLYDIMTQYLVQLELFPEQSRRFRLQQQQDDEFEETINSHLLLDNELEMEPPQIFRENRLAWRHQKRQQQHPYATTINLGSWPSLRPPDVENLQGRRQLNEAMDLSLEGPAKYRKSRSSAGSGGQSILLPPSVGSTSMSQNSPKANHDATENCITGITTATSLNDFDRKLQQQQHLISDTNNHNYQQNISAMTNNGNTNNNNNTNTNSQATTTTMPRKQFSVNLKKSRLLGANLYSDTNNTIKTTTTTAAAAATNTQRCSNYLNNNNDGDPSQAELTQTYHQASPLNLLKKYRTPSPQATISKTTTTTSATKPPTGTSSPSSGDGSAAAAGTMMSEIHDDNQSSSSSLEFHQAQMESRQIILSPLTTPAIPVISSNCPGNPTRPDKKLTSSPPELVVASPEAPLTKRFRSVAQVVCTKGPQQQQQQQVVLATDHYGSFLSQQQQQHYMNDGTMTLLSLHHHHHQTQSSSETLNFDDGSLETIVKQAYHNHTTSAFDYSLQQHHFYNQQASSAANHDHNQPLARQSIDSYGAGSDNICFDSSKQIVCPTLDQAASGYYIMGQQQQNVQHSDSPTSCQMTMTMMVQPAVSHLNDLNGPTSTCNSMNGPATVASARLASSETLELMRLDQDNLYQYNYVLPGAQPPPPEQQQQLYPMQQHQPGLHVQRDFNHQKIAYRCHVCGSSFEDRHRLQQHLSIHLNLHPSWFEETTIKETMARYESKRGDYLCSSCNQRFETTADFDRHMHLHGDKPHQCELCNQDNKLVSFRYYRQLLTHLRSHCFLYSCRFVPDCKQTANRKDYLKLHILKHHLNNKLPEQYTVCCH